MSAVAKLEAIEKLQSLFGNVRKRTQFQESFAPRAEELEQKRQDRLRREEQEEEKRRRRKHKRSKAKRREGQNSSSSSYRKSEEDSSHSHRSQHSDEDIDGSDVEERHSDEDDPSSHPSESSFRSSRSHSSSASSASSSSRRPHSHSRSGAKQEDEDEEQERSDRSNSSRSSRQSRGSRNSRESDHDQENQSRSPSPQTLSRTSSSSSHSNSSQRRLDHDRSDEEQEQQQHSNRSSGRSNSPSLSHSPSHSSSHSNASSPHSTRSSVSDKEYVSSDASLDVEKGKKTFAKPISPQKEKESLKKPSSSPSLSSSKKHKKSHKSNKNSLSGKDKKKQNQRSQKLRRSLPFKRTIDPERRKRIVKKILRAMIYGLDSVNGTPQVHAVIKMPEEEPPAKKPKTEIEKLLSQVDKKKEMYRELLLFMTFLSMFLAINFLQRNPFSAYQFRDGIIAALVAPPIPSSVAKMTFNELGNWDDIAQWLRGVFVPSLDQDAYYSGTWPSRNQRLSLQYYNRLLGGIRIRQLRVSPTSCNVAGFPSGLVDGCYAEYSTAVSEKTPFGPDSNPTKYKYQTAAQTGSSGMYSKSGNGYYDGGGYVVDIPLGSNVSTAVEELIADNFWDFHSRALFITINTLNPNLESRVGSVYFLIEFQPGGSLDTSFIFKSFRLYLYSTPMDKFRLVLEIVFTLMIFSFLYIELSEMLAKYRKKGSVLPYFSDGWNFLDLTNLFLFAGAIGLYFIFVATVQSQKFDFQTTKFISEFESLSSSATLSYNISAFNIFLSFCKFFKFLKLNPRLYMLWRTLTSAGTDIFAFLIMFIIMLFGFNFMAMLSFGSDMMKFNSFMNSFGTTWEFILGTAPSFSELYSVNRALGPVFFIAFTVIIFICLVNVFVAIISDAYDVIHKENPNAPSVGDAVKKGVKSMMMKVEYNMKKRQGKLSEVSSIDAEQVSLENLQVILKEMRDPKIFDREDCIPMEDMALAIGPESSDLLSAKLIEIHNKIRKIADDQKEEEEQRQKYDPVKIEDMQAKLETMTSHVSLVQQKLDLILERLANQSLSSSSSSSRSSSSSSYSSSSSAAASPASSSSVSLTLSESDLTSVSSSIASSHSSSSSRGRSHGVQQRRRKQHRSDDSESRSPSS